MQNNRKIIGTNINSALALRDKTQKELAEHLNVKPNVISYFCNGERTPNTEQLIQISKYLNVSADFLLGLQKNPTLNEDYKNAENLTGLSETAINYLNIWGKNPFAKESVKIISELIENDSLKKISFFLKILDESSTTYIEKARLLNESAENLTIKEIEDLTELNMYCNVHRFNMSEFITKLLNKYDKREINSELKLDRIYDKQATELNTDQKGE